MNHALIVDDDIDFAHMLKILLLRQGVSVNTAATLRQARASMEAARPDLLLLDIDLPDGDGLTLLRDKELVAGTQVVLVTGQASVETTVQALRHGAVDYLVKPVSLEQVQRLIGRLPEPAELQLQVQGMNAELERSGRFGEMIGRSGAMTAVYEQVVRVAATAIPVFICGETGTGKEAAARTIHRLGKGSGPFKVIHCAELGAEGIAAPQFWSGVEAGLAEPAAGTLFLDEICDLRPSQQAQLVSMIESGGALPAGGSAPRRLDVRLIAATAQDARRAMDEGRLRPELFYHLNIFPVQLPPLRRRLDDLPLLCSWMLRDIGRREGIHKRIARAALERLAGYGWPGNLRELRASLERSWAMAEGREIVMPWLPEKAGPSPEAAVAAARADLRTDTRTDIRTDIRTGLSAAGRADTERGTVVLEAGATWAQAERAFVLAVYERHKRHKERTAVALGISVKTLYNKLRAWGV